MNIILYDNKEEKYKVNKKPTQVANLTGSLREESNISNPTITIERQAIDFNYVYIPDFKRYYYVTEITSVRNNLLRVSLHVDVLNSFKNQILQLKSIINNQETTGDKMFNDGTYKVKEDIATQVIPFETSINGTGYETPSLILTLKGCSFVNVS